MDVQVSYSLGASGATYVRLQERPVARTVSVSDLILVDLDDEGQPIGVDFAVEPQKVTDGMLERLADRFPPLKGLLERGSWMYAVA